ncbi:uncharacterized protein H6S33_001121 [Morchella sextelata]|uniref:uncharacterized protein n=1 Tax=Morchella sextelata TaxID=1174677 RepID=UPI001D039AA6|nr:uncharacterized protein H6S33_001121 [Morchella sextelata]KAH0608893.1 hypothetical protein H6S33_001121 [Morchella sextelata]
MSLTRTLLRTPHTIACIGRNYADHIKELNNTAPSTPFFFLKPPGTLLHPNAGPVLCPRGVDLHYEVELAAVMGREADDLTAENALDAVKGWCVGIDMTARNYQETAKSKGLPWTLCKGFKTFLPVSGFIPRALIPDAQDAELYLSVNGEVRQQDSTALMLFAVPRLLQHVTAVTTLYEDDLVLTGTPKGVGKVVAGDVMRAGIRVGGREIEEGRIEVRVEDRVGGYGA